MAQWEGFDPSAKILSVKKDGGDVDPLLTFAPVSWIVLTDGVAMIYVFTDLGWEE